MHARRLEEVKRRLSKARLHGLLVSFLPNINYLTGFTGSNAIVLIRPDDCILLTDGRYANQVLNEVSGLRVIIPPRGLTESILNNHLIRRKETIGFEADSLSVSRFTKLKKMFHQSRWTPTTSIVEEIRSRKDDTEITKIRQAVEITDRVFRKILTILRPGIRELEIAAEISYLHKSYGADADAFEPIVASGWRGALPHGRASEKKIKRGEMVTIDMGCRVQGYHSDMTRTIAVGRPSPELRRIHRIVDDALHKALDRASGSVRARALDKMAREHIRQKGYAKFFPHSLGHGLGIEVHELPRISIKSNDVFEEQNVIALEPGIYVPQVGGVRIENDVVIRDNGCEVLNTISTKLITI